MARLLDDLTDVPSLAMIGRLLRRGCGTPGLPVELRRRLGEMSVAVAADIAAWRRSESPGVGFIDRLHQGMAIGLTLLVAPDGRIFESAASYVRDRSGRPLSWKELMDRFLNEAYSLGVGRFRDHLGELRRWFVEGVKELERG